MSVATIAPTEKALTLSLTGPQKVAVVLMQMDQEQAAKVMREFTEDETDMVTDALLAMRRVDPSVADEVINEFYDVALSGKVHARGGRDVAVNLLDAALGQEGAAAVMDRLASTMAGRSFEFLNDVDAGQILSLLDGEHPQTIALVLAHLGTVAASAVLGGLDEEDRTDVAHCIATMGTPSSEAVAIVAESLKARIGGSLAPKKPVEAVGGVDPLVDIINRADVATEKAILAGLEARDPELAELVRSKMLTFGDIVKFEQRDVQEILRGSDMKILALAMKNSPQAVIDTILNNVTERNKALIQEETKNLGAVRMSQIEEARAEIVKTIRTLEAEEKITVHRVDGDEYVY